MRLLQMPGRCGRSAFAVGWRCRRWVCILPILTTTAASTAAIDTVVPAKNPEISDLAVPEALPDALLLVVRPGVVVTDQVAFQIPGSEPETAGQCAAATHLLTRSPGHNLTGVRTPANADLAHRLGLDRSYILTLSPGTDAALLTAQLRTFDRVFESVEPLAVGRADESEGQDATDAGPLPNDPLFPLQYALENFGQVIWDAAGKPDADIDASLAWGISRGSPSVIVAVLDSGISLSHPDLAGQLVHGYNFTSANTADVDDQFYSHGTFIAGVIGGILNNGVGVAGLAPGCKLMPVRVIDRFGFTAEQWVVDGIIYATDHGASVLNISLGFSSGSSLLRAAVQYAYESGVVLCASSGNIATDPIGFPARYPETIAVGATDNRDLVATFTSPGPEMTIAAPGRNIYSTWDTNTSPDTYSRHSGTSFAVPYVVGTAALIRSINPSLSPAEVRSVLIRTAEDVGAPGWDESSGAGRVNAYSALRLARTLPGHAQDFCRADLNADGEVDFADLQYFLAAFAGNRPEADLNGDGHLDFYDIQTFLIFFSQSCTQTQTKP